MASLADDRQDYTRRRAEISATIKTNRRSFFASKLLSMRLRVSKRIFLSLLVLLGLGSAPLPAAGQALLPYTLQIDSKQLEQQGLLLAQDAAQLVRFGQYQLALPRAQMATQLAPKRFQTWFLLGSLYVQASKFDQGITALKQAQSLEPKEASVLFTLGNAYFQQGKYDASVSTLQAGLKLKPDVPEALFDLGNAYYKINRFEQAIAQYQKAVAKEPQFWPAINNIGLIKYESGDVEAAIRQWKAAIPIAIAKDKAVKPAEPMLAIAVALYAKGDREQALKMGEEAILADARYADLKFLKENLWGDRLLSATKKFLETPRMQAAVIQGKNQPPAEPETEP